MEEDNRHSKVQAGKEALLAFQKKKAKRKKKKTTNLGETGDSSRSEAVSTSADHDSSEVAGSRSGNVSPIPFDEPGSDELPLSRQTTAEIPSPSIASNLKPHSERLHDNNALESAEGPNVTIQKEVHEAQIATLQQNVAFLQQKIADSMQVKETEMEKLLVKQEAIREALLKEKDEKHTAQIARITAELTNDHSYVPSVIEPDEMEAKRMQMIKEGMKELHAKEMERVLEQHKKEKDGIVKQCEERIEASRQEIEQLANEKIQEMHSQFMSAHQAMIEQQAFSESSANQWKQEVEKLQLFLEEMAQKNSVLENRHQDLLESHGEEIKEIRRSVLETEKCLNGWKAKAVSFETRLQESEMQEHALEKQYSEKLEVQQLTYLQHEENLKIEHSESIKKLQDEYEKEIAELESKFSSEINVLEESVSEASGNKASLDVAEVHMKSLEKQLKEFRNQEDHLSKLEERHAEEFLLLKQNHETEKAEEIERISTKFIAKIESLEEELSKLIDSTQSQSSKDLIESLKRKHQKEMDDLRSDLDGAHELEINKAKEEMRSQVTRSLVQQQEAEILSLKQQLNEDWNNRLTMALQELEVKLKEEKEVEVSNLKKIHETQMQSVASEVAAEKRVGELLDELQACHTKETELMDTRKDLLSQLELTRRQLESTKANLHKMSNEKLQLSEYSERCVQQINSMNADLNAAKECFKLEKQANAKATLELQESRSRIEVLEAELKCETSTDATMVQNLEAELAQREVEIADLQCSNQSLNADLNLLKQEQKQHSDEIFKLKQEMTSSVDSLTSMLKSKEEDVTALQSKLEFSEKAISDTEIHYNGVLSQSTKELDALQQKMSLQKSIDENASREIEARVGEMENEVFELKQELNAAREDLNIQSQENETLNGKIQDLMRDLETAGKEKDDAIAEFTLLKEEHERQIQNQQENWQKHVTDMEKTIKDLQSKLMTRDAAFCEVQKEFGRQLSEAEIRESSLQGKIDDSVEEKIGLMVTEKSSLEESLSQARQSLSDKLHEKTELEKQLMFHHIELERRLAEKQHLEDLLFEKSRLEHELTTQKEQLQAELKEIESTLRHKQDEFDSDKTEWLKELGEKDKIIQVKNVEVAERDQLYHSQEAKHANDISDLQANLSQKRKDDLESLSCELSTKHQKELAGTTANLEHRHNEVIQVLESNHKTELESLKESLTLAHSQEIMEVKKDLDERRVKEVSTVRHVLEQEMKSDLTKLQHEYDSINEQKLCDLKASLKEEYQNEFEKKLLVEKERLEQAHRLHVEALTSGMSEENESQLAIKLQQARKASVEEQTALKSRYEDLLSERRASFDQVTEEAVKAAQVAFNEELKVKLTQKEEELSKICSERLNLSNAEWEKTALDRVEMCRHELESKHQHELDLLKVRHSEEVKNAQAALQKVFEEKVEVVKAQEAEIQSRSIIELTEGMRKQEEEHVAFLTKMLEQRASVDMEVLKANITRLEEMNLEQQCCSEKLQSELEQENKQLQCELNVLSENSKSEHEELREMLATQEGDLKTEYEATILSLHRKVDELNETLADERATTLANTQFSVSQEITAKETEFFNQLSELQVKSEEKLHDTSMKHIEELKKTTEAFETQLSLKEAELKQLYDSHNREKLEIAEKHEEDIRKMQVCHLRKINEMKIEAARTSVDASQSPSEEDLQLQKEQLQKQNEQALWLQESRSKRAYAQQLENMKKEMEETYTDAIAQVHADSAIKSASELVALQIRADEEKEIAMAQLKAECECQLKQMDDVHKQGETNLAEEYDKINATNLSKILDLEQSIEDMKKAHADEIALLKQVLPNNVVDCSVQTESPVLDTAPAFQGETDLEALKTKYEMKLAELENALTSEKNRQIELLKKENEENWCTREQELRSQLEIDHKLSIDELVKFHNEAKTLALTELETELNLRMEKVHSQLVEEHMAKFKELTEQLQRVHESEVATLTEEKNVLESSHEAALKQLQVELEDRLQEEVESCAARYKLQIREQQTQHQLELDQKHLHSQEEVDAHKQKFESLMLQKEADFNERFSQHLEQSEAQQKLEQESMESALKSELSVLNEDLERKLVELQQEHEATLEKEAKDYLLKQEELKKVIEDKETTIVNLEHKHTEDLKSVEQDLMKRMQEIRKELEEVSEEKNKLLRLNETLQLEKAEFLAVMDQRLTVSQQVDEDNRELCEKVKFLEEQLNELRLHAEREHREEGNTLSLLQHEMKAANTERVVLYTALDAVHKGVIGALQFIASATSDAATVPPLHDFATPEGNSRSGQDSSQQSSNATPKHAPVQSPHTIDSGLASQQTSLFPSDVDMDLPAAVEESHPALGDTGSDGAHVREPSLDSTLTEAQAGDGPEEAPTLLSVSFLSTTQEPAAAADLTITQLDSTRDSTDSLSAVRNISVDDVPSLQADVATLQSDVYNLVQKHIICTSQLSHNKEVLLQAQAQLQNLSGVVKAKDAQLMSEAERLSTAEAKILQLIEEVESSRELAESMEDLLKEFKMKEKLNEALAKQVEEGHVLLNEKENEISEKIKQLQDVQIETERLNRTVQELTDALDLQRKEAHEQGVVMQGEMEVVQEKLVCAQQDCEALRGANKEMRESRQRQETKFRNQEEKLRIDLTELTEELRRKESEIKELEDFRNRLASKEDMEEKLRLENEKLQAEASHLEHELAKCKLISTGDTLGRLSVGVDKGKNMSEKLQSTLEDALLSLDEKIDEVQEMKERENLLQKEIETLQKEMESIQSSQAEKELLLQSSQEQLSALREHLEKTSAEKTVLDARLSEMKLLVDQTQSDSQQLLAENSSLKINLEQKLAESETLFQEKILLEKQVSEVVVEANFQEAFQEKLAQKDCEMELLCMAKMNLERKVTELSGAVVKHQENSECSERELSNLKIELAQKSAELETLKAYLSEDKLSGTTGYTEVEMKLKEELEHLRRELEAKHSGEMAFVKCHHQEQLEELYHRHQQDLEQLSNDFRDCSRGVHVGETEADEVLLMKIAELAPILENEAMDVKNMCVLHVAGLNGLDEADGGAAKESDSILVVVDALKQLLREMKSSKSESDVEDWRKELVEAVEKILEHEHSLLVRAVRPTAEHSDDANRYQQAMHQELLQHKNSLQQLHSADRESLLAETQQLKRMLEAMQREQKDQSDRLLAELQTTKTEANASNAEMRKHLLEAQSVIQQKQDNVLQLRSALNAEQVKTAQMESELTAASTRIMKLEHEGAEKESALHSLMSENKSLQDESSKLYDRFAAVEESAKRASNRVSALQTELRLSLANCKELQAAVDAKELEKANAERASFNHIATLKQELEVAVTKAARENQSLQTEKTECLLENARLLKTIKEQREIQNQKEVENARLLQHSTEFLEAERQTCIALRNSLQAKEVELTQTMEQHLQEKVSNAKAQGELNALRSRLSRTQEEVESLHSQLRRRYTPTPPGPSEDERRRSSQLESQLVATRTQLIQLEQSLLLAKEREQRSSQRHSELCSKLHKQLKKSTLLKTVLDEEVADRTDLKQMLDLLLKEERLQSLSMDSLRNENAHLQEEVMRLQREKEEWRDLAQSKSVPVDSVQTSELSEVIAKLQNDLRAKTAQNEELLDAQVHLRKQLYVKLEEAKLLQRRISELQGELMGTWRSGQLSECSTQQSLSDSKLLRLYAQYRQAEVHRKALIFQKRYLQCQIDAFYQTQQAALIMMADMGAPTELDSKRIRPKVRRNRKFKVAVYAVVALLRFQFIRKKKIKYLNSRISRLSSVQSLKHTASSQEFMKSATYLSDTELRAGHEPIPRRGVTAHGTGVTDTASEADPQLAAYIQGLERLQSRLARNKH